MVHLSVDGGSSLPSKRSEHQGVVVMSGADSYFSGNNKIRAQEHPEGALGVESRALGCPDFEGARFSVENTFLKTGGRVAQ